LWKHRLQNKELRESLEARAQGIGSLGAEEMETHQEELGSVQMLLDSFRTGSTAGGALLPDGISQNRGEAGADIAKAPLLLK